MPRVIRRRGSAGLVRSVRGLLGASFFIAGMAHPTLGFGQNSPKPSCAKPLYLTFDTGHMDIAPLVAEVLNRQKVRVTFFAANERTRTGDGSLGAHWAPWWKARAAEGHEFASHTWDHAYWRGDLKGVEPRFRIRPSAGAFAGREFTWDAKQYCANVAYAAERLQDHTGKKPLPLFRAPGGKTSRWLCLSKMRVMSPSPLISTRTKSFSSRLALTANGPTGAGVTPDARTNEVSE